VPEREIGRGQWPAQWQSRTIPDEAIWAAADALDTEGATPALNAVGRKLGGGSFTTISDAMSAWKKRQRQKAQPVTEPLPAELVAAVNSLAR